MRWSAALIATVALAACAASAPPRSPVKTVVVLGNKTAAAVCENTDADVERVRAAKWKAYAEKLETELGITHQEDEP